MPLIVEVILIVITMMFAFFIVFMLMFLLALFLAPIELSISNMIYRKPKVREARKSSFKDFSQKTK